MTDDTASLSTNSSEEATGWTMFSGASLRDRVNPIKT